MRKIPDSNPWTRPISPTPPSSRSARSPSPKEARLHPYVLWLKRKYRDKFVDEPPRPRFGHMSSLRERHKIGDPTRAVRSQTSLLDARSNLVEKTMPAQPLGGKWTKRERKLRLKRINGRMAWDGSLVVENQTEKRRMVLDSRAAGVARRLRKIVGVSGEWRGEEVEERMFWGSERGITRVGVPLSARAVFIVSVEG